MQAKYVEFFCILVTSQQRLSLEGVIPALAKIISVCWAQDPSVRPHFGTVTYMLQQDL